MQNIPRNPMVPFVLCTLGKTPKTACDVLVLQNKEILNFTFFDLTLSWPCI